MSDQKENTKQLLVNWLNAEMLSSENQRLKNLLYDETTELPTLPYYVNEIKTLLNEFEQIGLLYVDITKESDIEKIFGWRIFDEILLYTANSLVDLQKKSLRENDKIAIITKNENAFVVLIAPSRKNTSPTLEDMLGIRERIVKDLNVNLKKTVPLVYKKFKCNIGYSFIKKLPHLKVERLIFDSIEEAQKSIHQTETKEKEMLVEQLKKILKNEELSTLLQPIVNLSNQQVLGYEAFNHGPEGDLKNPEKLFTLATENNLVCQLDKICKEKSFQKALANKNDGLLFININLNAIKEPVLREFSKSEFFESDKIPSNKIVFEVSEQSAVENIDLFQSAFNYLKSKNFKIAIDDMGSGHYTNLQIINRIKPDFIKIDIPLIRNVDKDIVKQELVSSMVRLSFQSGIEVIAEGIETSAELNMLRNLNVQYGQGYFIARPC
jgi:EAL domain-containing protein (putative c-di-GMP-specific phosphodiesterase class I)